MFKEITLRYFITLTNNITLDIRGDKNVNLCSHTLVLFFKVLPQNQSIILK